MSTTGTFDDVPRGIQITVEADIEFKCETDLLKHHNNTRAYVIANFTYGICHVGYFNVGSKSWSRHATWPVREHKKGIQYFSDGMWKSFDEKVQKAYSDFMAEREILS